MGLVQRLRKNRDKSPLPPVRYLLQLCTPNKDFEFPESRVRKRYSK